MHRDIQNLLQPNGATLYDRELMLREVLLLELTKWMDRGVFDNFAVRKFRDIVRDINGLPSEGYGSLPHDIDRLHCIAFTSLSPATLKGSLLACFEHAGINQTSANDLLGADHWQSILAGINGLCGEATEPVEHAECDAAASGSGPLPTMPDQWVVTAILSKIREIFGGKWFNICAVDTVSSALDELRNSLDQSAPDTIKAKQAYAGLRALHCAHYDAMPADVLSGLKAAVLQALELNKHSVQILLGADAWAEIAAMSLAEPRNACAEHAVAMPAVAEPAQTKEEAKPGVFAAVLSRIFGSAK